MACSLGYLLVLKPTTGQFERVYGDDQSIELRELPRLSIVLGDLESSDSLSDSLGTSPFEHWKYCIMGNTKEGFQPRHIQCMKPQLA